MNSEKRELTCRGCGHVGEHKRFRAREMMFGMREEFEYFECSSCGSLQIATVPADLGRFYPNDYYSLELPTGLKRKLQACWAEYSFSDSNLVGRLVGKVLGKHQGVASIAALGVNRSSRILDVGCGAGDLLLQLHHLGFSHLTGVDPFLAQSVTHGDGLSVLKQSIHETQGTFDVIMFNHSLEHVPNPKADLASAERLLAPGGSLVVALPVAGSEAWELYGPNWVALDPPRHIYIPTPRALTLLGESLGLQLASTTFESDEFMFWGSEQYASNIPLNDPKSYAHNRLRRLFPSRRMRQFQIRARDLNKTGRSDAARFVFQKA